ncbi:helix-turn-helix domain-containing protein [Patescibacteria group bacterium]|nr:helix-turn-helix domain-containing protein [Patescibacteria group bacterium]
MSTDVQKTFGLSRKDAAQILKVSTRTLDRYIIKNILSTRNIAGRIFLSAEEVADFIKETKRKKRRKSGVRKEKKSQFKDISRIVAHERNDESYAINLDVKEENQNDLVEVYDLPVEKPEPQDFSDKKFFDIEIGSMPSISDIEAEKSTEPEDFESEYGDVVQKDDDFVYKKLYEEQKEEVRSFQRRLEGANYRVGQLESQIKESVPLLDHQKLLTGHKKEVFNKKILYILLIVLLLIQPIWLILAFL